MQTFLPCFSFQQSAASLDDKRLGKQRVEAKQILLTLAKGSGAWTNHPAVKMWRGYKDCLSDYGWFMCMEWKRRGFTDNLATFFEDSRGGSYDAPQFIGNCVFHNCHRRVLIYKGWQDAVWAWSSTISSQWKGQKSKYIDYLMYSFSKYIDYRTTHYGKQWPDLEPLAPVNGSFPYIWPV